MTARKVGLLLILCISFSTTVEALSPRGTAEVDFEDMHRRIQQDKEREENDKNNNDKNNDKNVQNDKDAENESTLAPVILPTFSSTSKPTTLPPSIPPKVEINTGAPTTSPHKQTTVPPHRPETPTIFPADPIDDSTVRPINNPTGDAATAKPTVTPINVPSSDTSKVAAPLLDFEILLRNEFSQVNVTELDITLENYIKESMIFPNIEEVALKIKGSDEISTQNGGQNSEIIQTVGFQGHVIFIEEAASLELLHAQQEAILMNFYSLQKSIDSNARIGSGLVVVDVIIGGSTEELIDDLNQKEAGDIGDWFYEGKEQARPIIVGATVTFVTMAINVLMLVLRYRAILNK